jgi:hypothetical protein
MKLLFLENRHKTFFFDEIAKELAREHEIFWIVQNHNFLPQTGKVFKIPYPKEKHNFNKNVDLSEIIESDRQLNYFNKKDTDYIYYYYEIITKLVDEIKPDFVFGESTAFHELLTIKICKEKNILFLQPSSCRYPSGRFSFYKYDTVYPYLGSNELISEDKAIIIINTIIERSSKPDYMKKVSINKGKVLKDKIKILTGYLQGEKYNTPNPIIKFNIERKKKKNINIWDENSITEIDKNSFSVLYPLHLQPEANIDVWGRERRDQLKSIKEISENLKEGQLLYVKPNPKSKYELSDELFNYIISRPNIKMIHHSISMDTIFKDVNLFITVNGTIALECIFSNKPILTLVDVFFNKAGNCLFLQNIKSLQKHIDSIIDNDFPKLIGEQKLYFLNFLNKTSFKGIISDPYCAPNCVHKTNTSQVVNAFNMILKR